MAFDLVAAKARLNLSGSSSDAMVQVAIDTALAIAERYCDRAFLYKAETASFYYFMGEALQLPRYPVEQVSTVTGFTNTINYRLHHSVGQVQFGHQVSSDYATVTYAGGYRVLPADLELALWAIFDDVWTELQPTSGSSTSGSGAITSISVPDVGTIRMEGSGKSSGNGGAGVGGIIPDIAINLLEPYRLWKA
jgi:hypothetical protein